MKQIFADFSKQRKLLSVKIRVDPLFQRHPRRIGTYSMPKGDI